MVRTKKFALVPGRLYTRLYTSAMTVIVESGPFASVWSFSVLAYFGMHAANVPVPLGLYFIYRSGLIFSYAFVYSHIILVKL